MRFEPHTAWRRLILAGLTAVLFGPPAIAAPGVLVEGAWCWPSRIDSHTAFVYMSLTLADEDADRLLRAGSDLAAEAQILAPGGTKGAARLMPVPAIALDGHAPTILEPGATHLILRGLKRPLRPGDSVPVTLEFEHAPAVTLPVKVLRDPPGTGMPDLPKGIRLE